VLVGVAEVHLDLFGDYKSNVALYPGGNCRPAVK
jgi:hypothetical protein